MCLSVLCTSTAVQKAVSKQMTTVRLNEEVVGTVWDQK